MSDDLTKEKAFELMQLKNTKYALSTYDLKIPKWKGKPLSEITPFLEFDENPFMITTSIQVFKKDNDLYIESLIRKLHIIFQIEEGDFHSPKAKEWEECILLITSPFKKKDKLYVSGFIQIDNNTKEINLAWIHPYLRGKGLFSNLYLQLMSTGRFLLPTAPVSKAMLIAVDRATKCALTIENPNSLLSQAINCFMEYLKKHPDRSMINREVFSQHHNNINSEILNKELETMRKRKNDD